MDRDELLLVRCSGCGEVVGEMVEDIDEYEEERKAWLKIGMWHVKRAVGKCSFCGQYLRFSASDGLARILRRKGVSEEQIKQIFMEME